MGTPYYNSLRAAGLIDADYAMVSGSLYDMIGGRLITPPAGGILQRNGLFNPFGVSAVSSGLHLQGATEGTVMCLATPIYRTDAAYAQLIGDVNTGVTAGFQIQLNATGSLGARIATSGGPKSATAVGYGSRFGIKDWYSFSYKNNDGLQLFLNGVAVGAATSLAGLTYTQSSANGMYFGQIQGGARYLSALYARAVVFKQALVAAQQQVLQAELNSISYPTAVYEIWTPDYPTVKDGTPSFALCCGETTDKANGVTPTTATAVVRKKDTQMADYLQFTRTSSSKLDYGIQTQNQLNAEFEWDGDVYFDTDAVGQITEVIKVGDSATGVCFGLRKLATEKFQFIYGNELTVDFTYSVPSLGPLHIVLRREWVSGTTYDIKLWVNGSYIEKVTGSYAGTGNASAKTYIGYSGNITNTNFLSGRIYYSVIYPHLRPVEKFQKNPFSKNMVLGWGVRANNTVNTVERDTDNVVTVVSGGATFKVNSGFGDTGKLQKWLETGASAATFRIRNISSNDGLTVYYRALTTRTWTEGDGSAGDLTVDATGLFTLAANRAMLWSEL